MTDGKIVGIDGGGSKTLVAAADRTGTVTTLLRGRATSPLESTTWGFDLEEQVRPVLLSRERLLAVAAALPAHGEVEAVSAAQRRVIADLFGAVPQRVLNDVDAAHLGAFAGGAGILILSGTGSMAWGRDADGASVRTGGWGEVVGDEGSAHWVGKRVLEAVSQSIDGRSGPTGLVDATVERLGLDRAQKVSGLEGWASTLKNSRFQIAALAPLATSLAENGDATARTIVDQAADELARHVRTLEKKLGGLPAWSFAGGMFASAVLLDAVTDRLGRPPQEPKLPPIGGALLAAAQHLGWQPDAGWIERLSRSISAVPARTEDSQSTH